MAGKFAAGTEVSAEGSRGEIETTLRRYGAKSFAYAWDDDKAMVAFVAHDRQVRFVIPLPPFEDFATTRRRVNQSATKTVRLTPEQQTKAYDQAVRQRWRALTLVVKAKLEAVESEIASFEDEFMAYTVLPNGQTVAEHIGARVEEVVRGGTMPTQLLPGVGPLALPAGAHG